MNKSDFNKGQIVYLKYIGDRRYGVIGDILEATVKSVGSKYITTINGDWNTERKFEIDNDFRESYTIGGSDYQLFLSRQQIEDENESTLIQDKLRKFIGSYGRIKLTLDQLRRIEAVIDEK